jgi:hypothetical protein
VTARKPARNEQAQRNAMQITVVEAVCVVAIGIATVHLKPGAFTSDLRIDCD